MAGYIREGFDGIADETNGYGGLIPQREGETFEEAMDRFIQEGNDRTYNNRTDNIIELVDDTVYREEPQNKTDDYFTLPECDYKYIPRPKFTRKIEDSAFFYYCESYLLKDWSVEFLEDRYEDETYMSTRERLPRKFDLICNDPMRTSGSEFSSRELCFNNHFHNDERFSETKGVIFNHSNILTSLNEVRSINNRRNTKRAKMIVLDKFHRNWDKLEYVCRDINFHWLIDQSAEYMETVFGERLDAYHILVNMCELTRGVINHNPKTQRELTLYEGDKVKFIDMYTSNKIYLNTCVVEKATHTKICRYLTEMIAIKLNEEQYKHFHIDGDEFRDFLNVKFTNGYIVINYNGDYIKLRNFKKSKYNTHINFDLTTKSELNNKKFAYSADFETLDEFNKSMEDRNIRNRFIYEILPSIINDDTFRKEFMECISMLNTCRLIKNSQQYSMHYSLMEHFKIKAGFMARKYLRDQGEDIKSMIQWNKGESMHLKEIYTRGNLFEPSSHEGNNNKRLNINRHYKQGGTVDGVIYGFLELGYFDFTPIDEIISKRRLYEPQTENRRLNEAKRSAKKMKNNALRDKNIQGRQPTLIRAVNQPINESKTYSKEVLKRIEHYKELQDVRGGRLTKKQKIERKKKRAITPKQLEQEAKRKRIIGMRLIEKQKALNVKKYTEYRKRVLNGEILQEDEINDPIAMIQIIKYGQYHESYKYIAENLKMVKEVDIYSATYLNNLTKLEKFFEYGRYNTNRRLI